ncbi:MAG TPA: hypothetical protein VF169_03720 [Albitalea sp.]|uniref:hypothetical protein n=1 Tax=Piscinibacter sp. TaxID=1903157 RepID=UPI002ED4D8D8
MSAQDPQAALLSALTTEHFVLQTAASSTISEASARATLYMASLSSVLVAMGFSAQTPEVFMPLAATALPALFLLGVFTIVRLVDTALENMQYLAGIARIRRHYRSLAPPASELFGADAGRWPETRTPPSLQLGRRIAFCSTTASMIAFVNHVVAGAGVTLLVDASMGGDRTALAVAAGVVAALLLTVAFFAYQGWRFAHVELAGVADAPR